MASDSHVAASEPLDAPLAWPRLRRAPLLPLALAATIGLVFDRYSLVPLPVSYTLAIVALIACVASAFSRQSGLIAVYFAIATAALAAAYHHQHRHLFAADDLGEFITSEAQLVRVQGRFAEEPTVFRLAGDSRMISQPRPDLTFAVLAAESCETDQGWQPVSGLARLTVQGTLEGLHVGDDVEVMGWLSRPESPGNPGERDQIERLADARIRAELFVGTPAGVVRLSRGWPENFQGWLAVIRGWGRRTLEEALPAETAGTATALLLGDGSAMESEAWEQYMRSGVLHVLAISGQHLVVLGAFLWLVLRCFGVRRRHSALGVALFLIAYSLMTGGRPAALRAAVMVAVICGGVLLRRRPMPANTLAAAWLIIIVINPTDPFTPGCQLSFIATAVLMAVAPLFAPQPPTPMAKLIAESRSHGWKTARWLGRGVLILGGVNTLLLIATAPLICSWNNIVSPSGLLVGPIVVLLTSVALILGFLLLLIHPLVPFLAIPFAWFTSLLLQSCQELVELANELPYGFIYLAGPPQWLLIGFYGGLVVLLVRAGTTTPSRAGLGAAGSQDPASPRPAPEKRVFPMWKWASAGIATWATVGMLAGLLRPAEDELRITFLSVGHGGCTVVETLDGRVLLYDAGAITGPEVTRKRIAPYLWQRGIRRIDEVFLSHADLDHINGLPDLMERFHIGQVTLPASFATEDPPGALRVLNLLAAAKIPIRRVSVGDQLTAGDLTLEVLHPSRSGIYSEENARSLVLLLRHAEHRILLTGDLSKDGLAEVMQTRIDAVNVLMAPHHGSRTSNTVEFANWARPRLVVSSQNRPRWPAKEPDVFTQRGIPMLTTWQHGAVTLRSRPGGLVVETYRTGERWSVGFGER